MSTGASSARIEALRSAIEGWYRPRRRAYPWRRARPDPYRVLVSEFMLQQTQATRVEPKYREFLERFPDVRRLASSTRAEVIRAWAGLGYNRRAVALSEAARSIVNEHAGAVPSDPGELMCLPGVGPYTAAAVASIAFGIRVSAIDVNVGRVAARAVLGRDMPGTPSPDVRAAAESWLDPRAPGDWNQALMDLGRTICRPAPRCDRCPLSGNCAFAASGASPVAPAARSQAPFVGSDRQVRGAVVRELRGGGATLRRLAASTGFPPERVVRAIAGLQADGLVRAGPAALEGRPAGRVTLA